MRGGLTAPLAFFFCPPCRGRCRFPVRPHIRRSARIIHSGLAVHRLLLPKIVTVLRDGYTRKAFASDAIAGVIVGVVALPLAIAFAIASGVKPEQGLYTAIVAGIVVAVLGGSRVQVAGPTGAFIVIIYGVVRQYGYDGLAIATLMAGVLLVIMGIARLGTLLKFVPYPLIVGFTSGIALIIFTSQLRDFLGLDIASPEADFVGKWMQYSTAFATADLTSLLIGLSSLLIIVVWPRVTHRVPGSLVAILLVTAAVEIFQLKVATIGSLYGAVPMSLPMPHIPHVTWQQLTGLFSPALTIAILAAIESLLSAVVADGMLRTRHRSNMELIAQGAANLLSPLFGGIPATGAIARTATNIKNGGRTPIAAIVHSVTLLVIMLFFGRWASLIPMPTLAAILIVVSYNMSEWRSFGKLLKSPRSDVAVMLVTFILTVAIDLTVAIQVGIILSSLLFIKRMAEVSQVNAITRDLREDERASTDLLGAQRSIPDGVEIFEVFGTLFFGAVERFTESIRQVERMPRVLILETSNLLAIDATGLHTLEVLAEQFAQGGTALIISGIHKQPLFAIEQSGLMKTIGEDNFCGSLDEALERAAAIASK
ncbi:MAG: STAS domain-containing protein [Ignavibacteria bacterium]|nr:STAS domain-containing protein [Ignavibacteria bacterium]